MTSHSRGRLERHRQNHTNVLKGNLTKSMHKTKPTKYLNNAALRANTKTIFKKIIYATGFTSSFMSTPVFQHQSVIQYSMNMILEMTALAGLKQNNDTNVTVRFQVKVELNTQNKPNRPPPQNKHI